MNSITLHNVRIYAKHGCFLEEIKIGSEYCINLTIEYDLTAAAISDKLNQTINYSILNQIINKQMRIRSNLIENVIYRIIKEIRFLFPDIKTIYLSVAKVNPPINGNVEQVIIKFIDNNF